MAHKELKYDAEARKALEAGVDAVANAVKITLGPKPRAGMCMWFSIRSSARRPSPTMA